MKRSRIKGREYPFGELLLFMSRRDVRKDIRKDTRKGAEVKNVHENTHRRDEQGRVVKAS